MASTDARSASTNLGPDKMPTPRPFNVKDHVMHVRAAHWTWGRWPCRHAYKDVSLRQPGPCRPSTYRRRSIHVVPG